MELLPMVVVVVLLVTTVGSGLVAPAGGTTNGVDNETVDRPRLADDVDDGPLPTGGGSNLTRRQLARITDIPYGAPPSGVQGYNREALQSVPNTSRNASVHPWDASLTQGRFLADAYVDIFAIQPSTRVRLAPDRQPLYIGSDGQVLGLLDYRVSLPPNTTTGARRVSWRVSAHEVETATLSVDGAVEETASGTRTPRLNYSGLSTSTNEETTVELAADIRVAVTKRVRACVRWASGPSNESGHWTGPRPTPRNGTTGECQNWHETRYRLHETVTVRDSTPVAVYDPTVEGYRAQYPDGEAALVIRADQPIAGVHYSGGGVSGVWRFFVTSDDRWGTLARSQAAGTDTVRTTMQPLRVSAYPSAAGVGPTNRQSTSIHTTYGPSYRAPDLPRTVQLDVASSPYTATRGFRLQSTAANGSVVPLTVTGLVRGVTVDATDRLETVSVRRPNLTLAVVDETPEHVTVRVTLRDERTTRPISTEDRAGFLTVAGRHVNTTADGTAQVQFPNTRATYTARFEPGALGRNPVAYAATTDVLYVQRSSNSVAALETLAVPTVAFLIAVFLIDRTTGWDLWPPWRGL